MSEAVERSLAVSPLAQLIVGCDGSVRASSRHARELLGLPTGVRDVPFGAVATADAAAAVLDIVQRACANDVALSFDDQLFAPLSGEPRRLSGGVVPLTDSDGGIVAAALTLDPVVGGLREHNDELLRDNTELRSIADDLRQRTDELNLVAVFLQSVLTSLRGAVIVADNTFAIRVWNAEAERLWGIPRRTAMRSLLSELDLGFPQDLLAPSIEAAMRGEVIDDVEISVRRTAGDHAAYNVSVTPLLGPGASVHGVTLLFVERRTL
jgi:PAS domain-containing protein